MAILASVDLTLYLAFSPSEAVLGLLQLRRQIRCVSAWRCVLSRPLLFRFELCAVRRCARACAKRIVNIIWSFLGLSSQHTFLSVSLFMVIVDAAILGRVA